jgi:hypothetical protein
MHMDTTIRTESLEDLIEGSIDELEIDTEAAEWDTTKAPMAIGTVVGTFIIHC